MADQQTANILSDDITSLIRELTWLVEAAQENERISEEIIVGRGLYSDLGEGRSALKRFKHLKLIERPNENELYEIRLENVVALLKRYDAAVPPTVGLTLGTWQLAPDGDQGQETERCICAYNEKTQITTTIAILRMTVIPGENVVNGRAMAAVPELLQIIKAYMSDHACCTEEEPGEGCPCSACEQSRTLLAALYGRQYTPVREE